MKTRNPVLYNTLSTYISENKGYKQDAINYFKVAEQLIENDNNNFLKSNFYIRNGEFYLRINEYKNATNLFLKSFNAASNTGYLDHLLVSAKNLESLNALMNDYKEAYKYSKLYSDLKVKKNNLIKEKDFLNMELEKEAKQMKLIEEKRAKERQKKIQFAIPYYYSRYKYIVCFFLFCLAV